MNRPTRSTAAGQAYLDLQNHARTQGRGTQEFLALYVIERWLARLSMSPYADQFVIKGGILLAAYDARRPTADLDALASAVANDQEAVMARIVEIARQDPGQADGVEFRTETISSRVIRGEDLYAGVRVSMDCAIATAAVKFRLDVNFGDPVTPAPRRVILPSLRPGMSPIEVLGYPIETVLAEKITTAIALGPANTRVRDYADIFTLIGGRPIDQRAARDALLATAAFRGTVLVPLSFAVDNIAGLRRQTYLAYRRNLGQAAQALPAEFGEIVGAVTAFADGLVAAAPPGTVWSPQQWRWVQPTDGQHLPLMPLCQDGVGTGDEGVDDQEI